MRCWGKPGFTLAEVIITMTIVGVIAAMTIPTLHYQRTKKEYSAKLKNFYSRIDNAILDMELDKGSFKDMKKPTTHEGAYNWYIRNIDPYMGHEYVEYNSSVPSDSKIYFKDGSAIVLFWGTGGCMDILYDTNGDKAPNQEGFDRHRFLFCFSDGLNDSGKCVAGEGSGRCYWFGNKDIFFGTYGGKFAKDGKKRQDLIAQCKTERAYCTRLLQNDQWEFKSGYPHKF